MIPVQKPPVRLKDAIQPSYRELDPGSAVWAGVIAPLMGALGFAVENVAQLEAILRALGVPGGTITAVLFSLGLVYAAVTRSKKIDE